VHEVGFAQRAVEIACGVAREHGGAPITRVSLRIGAYCQVVPESMDFAFRAVAKGTLAENAEFAWETVPLEVECGACRRVYLPEELVWTCPGCGASGGRILQGGDLTVESIEIRESDTGD
jgi:hydrogenase nickel incorporation protein HypA/HybF